MQDKTFSEPATKGDVQAVKADVQAVKTDLQTVKADVQAVKADVQVLKTDMQAVKADVQKLSETVVRIAIDLTKTQATVREMQETMATKTDVNRIMNAIDAFTAQAQSYNNHDAIRGAKVMAHEATIEDHEKRLVVLENKK